jgi:hypothetical protein
MKYFIRITLVIGLFSIHQSAYSDSISDTYNTGDTLTASTLNTIKDAVNDNDSRIGTLEGAMSIKAIDANDLVIGELVSVDAAWDMLFDVFTLQEYLEVDIPMTPKFGQYARLLYLTTDCTGAAYSHYPNGTVFLALQLNSVYAKYYIPKASVAQNITPQSSTSDSLGPCHILRGLPIGENPDWYFPASQNVPAITGVADVMYTLPITFQRQ